MPGGGWEAFDFACMTLKVDGGWPILAFFARMGTMLPAPSGFDFGGAPSRVVWGRSSSDGRRNESTYTYIRTVQIIDLSSLL